MSRILRHGSVAIALLVGVAACSSGSEGSSNSADSSVATPRTKNAALVSRQTLAVINGCEFVYENFYVTLCKKAKSETHQFFSSTQAVSGQMGGSVGGSSGMAGFGIYPPAGTTYMQATLNFVDGTTLSNIRIPISQEIVTATLYKVSAVAPLTGKTTKSGKPQTTIINGCEFGYSDYYLYVCKGFTSETHVFLRGTTPVSGQMGGSIANGRTSDAIAIIAPIDATGVQLNLQFGDNTKFSGIVPLVRFDSPSATLAPTTTTTLAPTTTSTTTVPPTTVARKCYVSANKLSVIFCKFVRNITYVFLSGTNPISGTLSNTFPSGSMGVNWRAPFGATAVRVSATFIDGTSVVNVVVPTNGSQVDLPIKP